MGLAADPEHGALVARVSGCAACHTVDGEAPYAGGYAIETRFGTFYGPNLTADPEHGLGGWSYEDFERAVRHGKSPAKKPYYPAFPFTSYTRLTDDDLADLWAYMQTLAPVATPNQPHALRALYRGRYKLRFWRMLAFRPGTWENDPTLTPALNRGAYLVQGPGHCGECHTPRTPIGRMKRRRFLAGHDDPPEPSPNITPHADGLSEWRLEDLVTFFELGMTAEGDFVGGEMKDVVREGTAHLSEQDRRAMAAYLLTVPARPSRGAHEEPTDDLRDDW